MNDKIIYYTFFDHVLTIKQVIELLFTHQDLTSQEV